MALTSRILAGLLACGVFASGVAIGINAPGGAFEPLTPTAPAPSPAPTSAPESALAAWDREDADIIKRWTGAEVRGTIGLGASDLQWQRGSLFLAVEVTSVKNDSNRAITLSSQCANTKDVLVKGDWNDIDGGIDPIRGSFMVVARGPADLTDVPDWVKASDSVKFAIVGSSCTLGNKTAMGARWKKRKVQAGKRLNLKKNNWLSFQLPRARLAKGSMPIDGYPKRIGGIWLFSRDGKTALRSQGIHPLGAPAGDS